jgi:hypothetical protein
MRTLLSLLSLLAAIVVAAPAVVTLTPGVSLLGNSAIRFGLAASETHRAAAELTTQQGPIACLILAALFLGNYTLLRILGAVEKI